MKRTVGTQASRQSGVNKKTTQATLQLPPPASLGLNTLPIATDDATTVTKMISTAKRANSNIRKQNIRDGTMNPVLKTVRRFLLAPNPTVLRGTYNY